MLFGFIYFFITHSIHFECLDLDLFYFSMRPKKDKYWNLTGLKEHIEDILLMIIFTYRGGDVIYQLSIGNTINPLYFAHT